MPTSTRKRRATNSRSKHFATTNKRIKKTNRAATTAATNRAATTAATNRAATTAATTTNRATTAKIATTTARTTCRAVRTTTTTDSGDDDDDDDDEDDSEDDDDEQYMQKLKKNATIDYLKTVHPELQHHDYMDVLRMSHIERDKNGIIVDPHHRMLPFLTKYEKARILGVRTTQLNHGHPSMVHTTFKSSDMIALEEYRQKKIPFIIRRALPNGTSEYWRFADLEQLG